MFQKFRTFFQKQNATGALLDFLQHPMPDINDEYRKASYLVLDLETTGLNPENDEIISVGMVTINNWRIRLGDARHILVKPEKSVSQSAIYHGIVDDHLENADPLKYVMPRIFDNLKERILVVHGASIDVAFLDTACQRLYGVGLSVHYVDTMALGMRRYRYERQGIPNDALRLHQLRKLYHLPQYAGHHALADALATAELFLAMAGRIAGRKEMPVKRLLF